MWFKFISQNYRRWQCVYTTPSPHWNQQCDCSIKNIPISPLLNVSSVFQNKSTKIKILVFCGLTTTTSLSTTTWAHNFCGGGMRRKPSTKVSQYLAEQTASSERNGVCSATKTCKQHMFWIIPGDHRGGKRCQSPPKALRQRIATEPAICLLRLAAFGPLWGFGYRSFTCTIH